MFLGASPERLIRVDGERVETAALAGTAPRGGSQAADRALGEALCECRKNGAEHAAVVDYLKSVLADCCDDVEVAAEPTLLRTRTVQHLCTELKARQPAVAGLAARPRRGCIQPQAVGGAPHDAALAGSQRAGIDRGWFAGPVGFLQSQGDGEFPVALRCRSGARPQRDRMGGGRYRCGFRAPCRIHRNRTRGLRAPVLVSGRCSGDALMIDQNDVRDVGAANLGFTRALVGELQAAGVATAFVCPGSRYTPLACWPSLNIRGCSTACTSTNAARPSRPSGSPRHPGSPSCCSAHGHGPCEFSCPPSRRPRSHACR